MQDWIAKWMVCNGGLRFIFQTRTKQHNCMYHKLIV